jgi:hypothetical protein
MMVDRDWRSMEGRWFSGGYDEVGIDVKLERVGNETRVLGHRSHGALDKGASAQELKIYGPISARRSAVGHRSRSGHHRCPRGQRDA